MELYLIRHGETVDNVAGLYAGIRDSSLTVHGVEQARRLGDHFANSGVLITHIFSSPLSRACKTAQSIQTAQQALWKDGGDKELTATVEIDQIADLIEQDFGYYEGKPFQARSKGNQSGKDTHRSRHKDQPGFIDVESKESMAKRADAFLDNHLLPIFKGQAMHERCVIAVVSHGMLLAQLWRRLLRRLPQKSVSSQEVISNGVEHLGGWSNTGYLHLSFSRADESPEVSEGTTTPSTRAPEQGAEKLNPTGPGLRVVVPSLEVHPLKGWLLNIVSIDNKVHLAGLKRQRGGIGRLAHDESQMKLDVFFKRQKTA